jgi:hypothetical protein
MDDYRRFNAKASTATPRYNAGTTNNTSAGGYSSYRSAGGNSYDSPGRRPGGRSAFADDDDDDDIEGIKLKINQTKKDTLDSTRNAVSKLKETEEIGERTLVKLGEQSEQIINVERQLDVADVHVNRAADQTSELKQLNKSIFAINIKNPFKSKKNKEAELAKVQEQYRQQSAQRGEQTNAAYQSKQRVEGALRGATGGNARYQEDGSKYTFEDEDPSVENEINDNLDIMSDSLARLKGIAGAMNQEVAGQNERLDRISQKTDRVGEKLAVQSKRLDKFK